MAANPNDLFPSLAELTKPPSTQPVAPAPDTMYAGGNPTFNESANPGPYPSFNGTPTPGATAPTAPALTLTPPSTLPTDPVQATTREVQPLETVQGQLNDLFYKGNPLMVQAREGAQRMAAGRGLQNSSIAAHAGEQALFSSAMPIASQDATAYGTAAGQNQQAQNVFGLAERQGQIQAGMNEQEFESQMNLAKQKFGFDTSLSAQDAYQKLQELAAAGDQQARLALLNYGYERNLTTLRGEIALAQSNNDFANRLIELAKQGDIQAQLAAQQFGFNLELSAQENLARLAQIAAQGDANAALQLQQFEYQSLLNDQQAGIQLMLEDARFQQNQNLVMLEYAERGVLSEQEAQQAVEQMNQQHANTLEQIQAHAAASNDSNAAHAGLALQNNYLIAVSERQKQASEEIARIYQTEGISSSQQNAAVQNAYDRMRQDLEMLGAYYSSSPLWDENWTLNPEGVVPGGASGSDIFPGTGNDAGTLPNDQSPTPIAGTNYFTNPGPAAPGDAAANFWESGVKLIVGKSGPTDRDTWRDLNP